MRIFVYDCSLYCEDCAREKIIPSIRDTFPKMMSPEQKEEYKDIIENGWYPDAGEADSPDHCGCGSECVNAIDGLGGCRIGAWLENPLTADGVKYVREAIADGDGIAWHLWQQWYADQLTEKPTRLNAIGLKIFNGD